MAGGHFRGGGRARRAEGQSLDLEDHTLPSPPSTPAGGEPFPDEDESLESRLVAALGDDYELGPQIGRGGMGIVFRATDLRLKREVAIKVLPPEVTYRADMRKRFVREAQVSASLTHPHIVPIYSVGNRGGLVWFVMAMIQGETVRDLVRRAGPQPVHIVQKILIETAWALSYAHAHGVIHRDIKPDNIMIDRASGRTIVTDFGLAKMRAEEQHSALTSAGGVVGTPAYMSPEQARGSENIDHRTDIYGLGLVGYFALSGRNPFNAKGQQAVLAKVLTEDAPDILTDRPDLPTWFADVINKAVLRDKTKRQERAELLANDLDQGASSAEVPTSVENLLDLLGAYGTLSLLGAFTILALGLPDHRIEILLRHNNFSLLPTGSFSLIAAVLAFPVLRAIHLMNAEGIEWPDIRNAIVARRIHWLRTASLRREAGLYLAPFVTIGLCAAAITIFWFFERVAPVRGILSSPTDWVLYLVNPDEEFVGFLRFRHRPGWALWYAVSGTLIWARVFGLPLFRSITPERLDAVASWRLPRLVDWAGASLFKQLRPVSQTIEATSDFGQLTDPAIQEALAFNRTRRALPWRKRLSARPLIKQGHLIVKRLWWTHEKLEKLGAARARTRDEKKLASLAEAIESRESMLSECASVLSSLRLQLEEAGSGDPLDSEPSDERIIEEARRLTAPIRWIRLGSTIYVVTLGALLVLLALGEEASSSASEQGDVVGALTSLPNIFILGSIVIFIGFQFFKRRLFT